LKRGLATPTPVPRHQPCAHPDRPREARLRAPLGSPARCQSCKLGRRYPGAWHPAGVTRRLLSGKRQRGFQSGFKGDFETIFRGDFGATMRTAAIALLSGLSPRLIAQTGERYHPASDKASDTALFDPVVPSATLACVSGTRLRHGHRAHRSRIGLPAAATRLRGPPRCCSTVPTSVARFARWNQRSGRGAPVHGGRPQGYPDDQTSRSRPGPGRRRWAAVMRPGISGRDIGARPIATGECAWCNPTCHGGRPMR
jgi:hypothetical protein